MSGLGNLTIPFPANWSGSKSFLVPEQRPRLAGESFIFLHWAVMDTVSGYWEQVKEIKKSHQESGRFDFLSGKSDQMKQQNQISWSNRGEVLWERERVLQILFETASGSWWSGQGPDKMITREHKLAKVSSNLERNLETGIFFTFS